MSLEVFISYSALADQIIALRLQTWAALYGLRAFVPPASTRRNGRALLSREVAQRIGESDVILAVVTRAPSPASIAEIEYARGQNKLILPIVGPGVDRQFLAEFPQAFYLDPQNPSQVEAQIVEFLKQRQTEEGNRNLLIALSALAVALLLFSAESG